MADKEEWRWVVGYEGLYMVSDLGNVMSMKDERGSTPMTILKQGACNSGYLHVTLHKDGHGKTVMVHRLVATAFLPNPDNKTQVNHKDGNRKNNHLSNLEWVTCSENILHSFRVLGRDTKGRKKTSKKLTKEQIIEIYLSEENGQEVAKRFNISDTMVYNIRNGKCWSEITCQLT